MINITEKDAKKCPGETSLYVKFNYFPEYVNIMKQCDGAKYDTKNKQWEVPISELSLLLNEFHEWDDINLTVLSDNVKEYEDITLDEFKTTPFDYQLDGIKYGLQHNKWLLLDAPGLGKSLQILYIAQELKKNKDIKHCLIVCGINTLKTNWKKEIELHTNLTCKILGERYNKKGNLVFKGIKERIEDLESNIDEFFVITNIESLRNDDVIKLLQKGKNKFDMIVLDEAHCCKNPMAQQTKNFLKLKSNYQIAATGTVITNSPLDTYVPLKWIGVEKCSYSAFRFYYVMYGGLFNNEILGYKHMDILKDEISNHSLRRTKDLLNLPEKTVINELIEMNPIQQTFYENIVRGIVDDIDKVTMSTNSLLSNIARLRQATVCPSILTSENIPSAKMERCMDLVHQIISNGEKVVVFSTFKESLNVMKQYLDIYNPLLCTGDVTDDIISENVDKFQTNDSYKIMLATWSKMGTGMTLTAANNVIFLDCAWTSAMNEQAEDRCYRIGSNKPVFIYYLWTNDTIDLRVKELNEDKSLMFDYMIDNQASSKLISRLKNIILDLV